MRPFPPSSAVHCAHLQHLLWLGCLLSLPLPPVTTTEPRQSRQGELCKVSVRSSCYSSSIKSQHLEGAPSLPHHRSHHCCSIPSPPGSTHKNVVCLYQPSRSLPWGLCNCCLLVPLHNTQNTPPRSHTCAHTAPSAQTQLKSRIHPNSHTAPTLILCTHTQTS